MSYVTGISGNAISAAYAGYAPTNSADVSAIASAYATGGGAQVVTSLQYATSESATVATTVTADTAVGNGARYISAEYYDYGYGTWIDYDSSRPLVQVCMTAAGDIRNYSSYPYHLYVVPYGATNNGYYSTTSQLTGALAYGEFSGGMNDFIIAEGTGSASQDPYCVEINFNVTHVPFVGSEPAFWGAVEGYAVVDSDEYTRPVFCVVGGYDGSQLFEVRNNVTAEMDFGTLVTVSAVSGINELEIAGAGGGIDSATVSAIASSYARDVSAAASGAVSAVSSNSANWLKLSSFSGVDGIVTAVGSSYGFDVSASAFMGIDSALKGTTGTLSGSEPYIYYTAQLPDGVSNAVILSAVDVTDDTVDVYYKDYNNYTLSVSLDSNLRQKAIVTNATGILTAMSRNRAFQIGFTAKQPEALAFQSDLTGAGVDSATVSAIASAYAESAQVVSSVDSAASMITTATYVAQINGCNLIASEAYSAHDWIDASSKLDESATADFYTTSNPSGFIDSAYVDSAVSSKADSSALSSYALSADVSGTVDLVSTQSANWGGSALALSAGPGVKLEKVGDTLVASVDGPMYLQETVAGYWNGSAVYQQFISGTALSNGNSNLTIPDEITGTNIVNKWIDPSNSFIYYNTTSNALPISWCLGSARYGSVGFVGSVINYRCVDTSPTTITAYLALKYMKA